MTKILVIGASRGIGLATVAAALDAGHTVRAFARSATALPRVDSVRCEVFLGDASDPAAVGRSLAGIDAVIQTLGVSLNVEAWLSGTTLFSKATRVLVDAMKALSQPTSVKRLIVVTGLGAGDSRGRGGCLYDGVFFPLILQRIYDDKDVQERIVRESGLDWTLVRPVGLTNGPATGRYRVLTDPSTWRAGFVSRRDVADFLVRQVTDRTHIHATPLVID